MNIAIFHDGGWFHKPLKDDWESKGHNVMASPNYSIWPDFEPDLIFFDTCTANIIYYSKYIKKTCPAFVRVHGVGIRFNHHRYVDWDKIDGAIFVNKSLKDKTYSDLVFCPTPGYVVLNGVDLKKFTLKRSFDPTYKIACVSRKIVLKNLDMVPSIMQKFKDIDERYEIHHAYGQIPHDEMNEWLEDKDYLIHPSGSETFCYAVAEAMAKGIRPLINNWSGSSETWGEDFYIDDFNLEKDPLMFRYIIEQKYNQNRMIEETNKICQI